MLSLKKILIFTLFLAVFSIFAEAQKKPKVDFAKKIDEATPALLPQSPVADKLKSDADDNNLKGRVKSLIEEVQYAGKKTRERTDEDYYDEKGNYIKTISFSDGYPTSVAVWGYIDGNRVLKSADINYAKGERPISNDIIMSLEDNPENSTAARDSRYSTKYEYKYNQNGQLSEELTYSNRSQLLFRHVYNYKGNQREKLDYGRDGSLWSQSVEILDKNGNVIEQYSLDEHDKPVDRETYIYEFDSQGNWIVQKAFNKEIVRGKTVLKPWFTAYRIITYYP